MLLSQHTLPSSLFLLPSRAGAPQTKNQKKLQHVEWRMADDILNIAGWVIRHCFSNRGSPQPSASKLSGGRCWKSNKVQIVFAQELAVRSTLLRGSLGVKTACVRRRPSSIKWATSTAKSMCLQNHVRSRPCIFWCMNPAPRLSTRRTRARATACHEICVFQKVENHESIYIYIYMIILFSNIDDIVNAFSSRLWGLAIAT